MAVRIREILSPFPCSSCGTSKLANVFAAMFFHPLERFTSSATLDEMTAFDNLIYVRHSTCADLTGFVANYAHELQHFMQHGYTPRLWVVNSALYQNLAKYEPDALATDIPSERDAEIKSKRVAEIVCGVNTVREFAEKQVRLMEEAGAYKQKGKWIFFRDVPSSTNYDLLQATLSFVEKYKGRINFGIDVEGAEWWLGPISDR